MESNILPGTAAKIGIGELNCDVRSVDLYHADFSDVRIGNKVHPYFSVDSLEVNYSPLSVMNKDVDSVILSSAEFNIVYDNGKFSIPGFDLNAFQNKWEILSDKNKKASSEHKHLNTDSLLGKLPFNLGLFKINNGIINFNFNKIDYRVPFNLSIICIDKNKGIFNLSCDLYPLGQKIKIKSEISLINNEVNVNLDSDVFHIDVFSEILKQLSCKITGNIVFNNEASFNLFPFKIKSIQSNFFVENFKLQYNNLSLDILNEKISLRSFDDISKLTLNISGNGIEVLSPANLIFKDLKSDFKLSEKIFKSVGSFNTIIPLSIYSGSIYSGSISKQKVQPQEITPNGIGENKTELTLPINYSAELFKSGIWNIELGNAKGENKNEINLNTIDIKFKEPDIKILGSGVKANGKFDISLDVHGLQFKNKVLKSEIDRLSAICKVIFSIKDKLFSSKYQLDLLKTILKTDTFNVNIPKSTVIGKFSNNVSEESPSLREQFEQDETDLGVSRTADGNAKHYKLGACHALHGATCRGETRLVRQSSTCPTKLEECRRKSVGGKVKTDPYPTGHGSRTTDYIFVSGLASISDVKLESNKLKTIVSGINLELPFLYPFTGNDKFGNIKVEKIFVNRIDLGSIKGTINQTKNGITYNGKLLTKFLDDLFINYSGETFFDFKDGLHSDLKYNLSKYKIKRPVAINDEIPALSGVKFKGNIDLNGNVKISPTKIKGELGIDITNSNLQAISQNILIYGINCSLKIPDLFTFKSDPEQMFAFDEVRMGNFIFNNGEINFQLESLKSILIEKGLFGWSGGKVFIRSMRVHPGRHDYDIFLFCDRLNLSEVLQQFGNKNISGTGTISGKVPIEISSNQVIFKDASLFSIPGQGGVLQFKGSNYLNSGIIEESNESTQLSYVRSALKDFNYEWAVLNLQTKENECILSLQLYGKPAKPLHFKYNQELNIFVKTELETVNRINTPIYLEMNFKVPINRILRYKTGIKDILEKLVL